MPVSGRVWILSPGIAPPWPEADIGPALYDYSQDSLRWFWEQCLVWRQALEEAVVNRIMIGLADPQVYETRRSSEFQPVGRLKMR